MSDAISRSVTFVEALDAAGLDFEVFWETIFRVSLEDAGLITSQLLEALLAENRSLDQRALMAAFKGKGKDRL